MTLLHVLCVPRRHRFCTTGGVLPRGGSAADFVFTTGPVVCSDEKTRGGTEEAATIARGPKSCEKEHAKSSAARCGANNVFPSSHLLRQYQDAQDHLVEALAVLPFAEECSGLRVLSWEG